MTGGTLLELIPPAATLTDALRAIERSPTKIAVVVDGDGRLLGTATDGNVRRAVLKGFPLSEPVSSVMNRRPVSAHAGDRREALLEKMRVSRCRQLPLLDDDGRVVQVVSQNMLFQAAQRDNLVFIFAGGLGARLHPLTQNAPKPMLPIGDKPILEHIVERFKAQGFHRFCFAVRYLSEQIREHFEDGDRWSVTIDYVCEAEPLGTAGALGLLANAEEQPLIVMNGDIITETAFHGLVDFHAENGGGATVCVRPYPFEIPFGVVDLNDHRVRSLREKPTIDVMVNAGIYCVDWTIVELVRARPGRVDMPDVLQKAIDLDIQVNGYPIHEAWVDIGQTHDLNRARIEFGD